MKVQNESQNITVRKEECMMKAREWRREEEKMREKMRLKNEGGKTGIQN